MKTRLGVTVRDLITGFEGVVTGRVEYISGCNQVLVVPKVKADGAFIPAEWFDEQRVVVNTAVDRIALDNGSSPGFDAPAPKR